MKHSSADHDILERLLVAGDDASATAHAVASVDGWERLTAHARRHGLSAMVHRAALSAGVPVPANVLDGWDAERALEATWFARLASLAVESTQALTARGIESAILKGPALAERLYAVPADRVSTDLDVLVREVDLDGAIDALRSLDFIHRENPTERWHRQHHHHLSLHRADGLVIEIHFRTFTGFGTAIPSEPMLDRARAHAMRDGNAVGVLQHDDEWLYLVAHAAGHLFERLSWVRDLQLFGKRTPAVDGSNVAMRAREFDLTRAVEFGANYLSTLGVRSPLPPHEPSTREQLAHAMLIATQRSPIGPPKQLGTMLFTGLLANDPARAGRLVARDAVRITRRRLQRYFPTRTPSSWAG